MRTKTATKKYPISHSQVVSQMRYEHRVPQEKEKDEPKREGKKEEKKRKNHRGRGLSLAFTSPSTPNHNKDPVRLITNRDPDAQVALIMSSCEDKESYCWDPAADNQAPDETEAEGRAVDGVCAFTSFFVVDLLLVKMDGWIWKGRGRRGRKNTHVLCVGTSSFFEGCRRDDTTLMVRRSRTVNGQLRRQKTDEEQECVLALNIIGI